MSATTEPAAWNGSWVADRLGAALVADSGLGGLTVHHLVGLALRVNPRRSHLLVSRVLGKHLPADPLLVQGAGRLLGAAVADLLSGRDSGTPQTGGRLLAAALSDEPSASLRLLALCDEHRDAAAPGDALVLGYAETATGLGHTVADALGADYLHSTRRPVGGVAAVGAFEEVHSHATSHLLLPEDPAFVAGPRPLVLVDDELSTGATVMNTVRAVQAIAPRTRYVVAALVDLRSDADRQELTDFAARTGVRMDVVALASGRIELPADALARGQELVTRYGRPATGAGRPAPPGRIRPAPPGARWPDRVRDGGRHGFPRAERAPFDAEVREVATALLPAVLPALPSGRRARLLVLGTEELMYLPMRIAAELAGRLRPAGAEVVFSTTTRSPVVAVDDAGYAIRTALAFGSHDDPADGPGPRYAYNVAPGEGQEPFDAAVLVVDACSTAWPAEGPRLPDVLAGVVAGPVTVVTVPSHRAGSGFPAPLHGPDFGSYRADEVGWLLTDLSDAELEAPVEEREEAIQAGTAHYAESLPVEYQPTPEYQRLFARTLASSAATLAHAVGLVTELVLAERGPEPVLVSLARAGTPVGILMRRWAEFAHARTLPHYAVSIVRGRGIDRVALAYLAAAHDPASVVFVDGWTGKGAIARELAAALADANAAMGLPPGRRFSPELAVLADPGHCVRTFGTRADFLIPSACLNSTVSGLVSRTVLNDELIGPGQFHGAKFYADLAAADVSRQFLDAVSSAFPAVADRVAAELPALAAADRTPTWAGWSTVERLAADYGVGNVNLVKPGVGETTRVLLRRVPWKVLLRRDAASSLEHVLLLAEQRGAEVELVDDMPYSCVGIVRPGFTRGGRASSGPGRATATDLIPQILIATDLDRTLIYSAAASGAADGVPPDGAVTVEHLDGRPISFMSAAAAGMLDRLSRDYLVVPVTTRTPTQLARVRLPGPPPRYAVAANGGVLLADGRPDADWTATVRSRVAAVAPLETAMETLSTVCDPEWAAPPRNAADLFCYAVVDRSAMPAGVLERLHRWADGAGWAVSLQGRKLYLVPTPLTKSSAVAEVARRTGTTFMLAAGDSLLDIDLLEAADRGVHPGHGEIADSGWSAPTVDALTATGLRAGEEILRWFAARVADGSTERALPGRVRRR